MTLIWEGKVEGGAKRQGPCYPCHCHCCWGFTQARSSTVLYCNFSTFLTQEPKAPLQWLCERPSGWRSAGPFGAGRVKADWVPRCSEDTHMLVHNSTIGACLPNTSQTPFQVKSCHQTTMSQYHKSCFWLSSLPHGLSHYSCPPHPA